MTSDATTTELATALAETRPVYDDLTRLRSHLADLRTVEEARVAYDQATAREVREIAALRHDRDLLAVEQRRRRFAETRTEAVAPPPSLDVKVTPPPATEPIVVAPVARPQSADRRKLKKLVSRWQFAWSLDAALVAQVNSIADDAERPLGEALAMLDWRLYETPIPGESGDAHSARVREWRDVLVTYVDHLHAEIGTIETRYRNVLAIWERWRRAQTGGDGLREWERFIDATRAQKQAERDALARELTSLREALGR